MYTYSVRKNTYLAQCSKKSLHISLTKLLNLNFLLLFDMKMCFNFSTKKQKKNTQTKNAIKPLWIHAQSHTFIWYAAYELLTRRKCSKVIHFWRNEAVWDVCTLHSTPHIHTDCIVHIVKSGFWPFLFVFLIKC